MTRPDEVTVSDAMSGLLHQVRRDGDRLFGSRRVQIVPLSFEVRESSEVARARVTTPAGPRHVFAKLLKPRTADPAGVAETRARLRHDFEVTRRVFEGLNVTADLRAVEPLAVYEDLLGVVTREAPGTRLDLAIGQHARWPAAPDGLASLDVSLSRIGRWVRAFQDVAPNGSPTALSLSATREYIDIRLQRLTRIPRAGFRERDRRAVLAHIERRTAEVPSADHVEVPVHGDITPSNILVAQDRVTVLDFAMTGRGSKYFDIARLYTQLEFYTAKPQFRSSIVTRLQQAALAGFDPQLSPDEPLFDIYAIQHVVCHYLSHSRAPGRFPASLYSRHQCRLHRRWLRERTRSRARLHDRMSEAAAQA